MGIFKEIPPTAGFPLYLSDFRSLFKRGTLEEDLKHYLKLDYVSLTYSGTAALYLILESLKELSGKTRVVIPSYVCPLLPLAIKRAGLKVEVCDIGPDNFDFDLGELENLCSQNNDILAVIAVHLGGIPVDFEPMEKIVKKQGIFIIEDCAQSLGATYHEKKTGTLGDFSFFSLCRGKGLTIYEGGVAATTQKEYAQILEKKINLLAKDDFLSEILKIWELLGYWVFYRPQLFWFVFQIPQIFWNLGGNKLKALGEYFTPEFPIHKVSRMRKSIGHAQFYRLEEELEKQRRKASFYLEAFKGIRGLKAIQEHPDTRATYPYLTLIFDTRQMRNKAWQILKDSGLGVSQIYAYAIGDYDYLKPIVPQKNYPGGRYLAEHTITVSTNAFLTQKDLVAIIQAIKIIDKGIKL
jgi:dTDP-4-amino-4,6-dideoxygalactose transaminase